MKYYRHCLHTRFYSRIYRENYSRLNSILYIWKQDISER